MPSSQRVLLANSYEHPQAFDSDLVVVLTTLLCALLCILGLALVTRCACRLRRSNDSSPLPPLSSPNRGLNKEALQSLPTISFQAGCKMKMGFECAICLQAFTEGDDIRVLPQCGHGFHVSCIDTWLGSNSSCPSCRQLLVVTMTALPTPAVRCQKCGACSTVMQREDEHVNRIFMP